MPFPWGAVIGAVAPTLLDSLFGGPSGAERQATANQSQLAQTQMQSQQQQNRISQFLEQLAMGQIQNGPDREGLEAAMFQFPDSAGGPTADPAQLLAAMMAGNQGGMIELLQSLAGKGGSTSAVDSQGAQAAGSARTREANIGESSGNLIDLFLRDWLSKRSFDTDTVAQSQVGPNSVGRIGQ